MPSGFIKKAVVLVFIVYLGISSFFYLAQELFIFPVLLNQILDNSKNPNSELPPPPGIERFFAKSQDGEKIDVWTTFKSGEKPKNVAIIFHGNGETLTKGSFLPFFRDLDIPAFSFDYRGYGRSSGWPSEEGLYLDAEAVWSEVQQRTRVEASNLIILGNSIGSGPGSYLARKLSPKVLILLAAYSDFPTLISGMPFYAPFIFSLRYKLPVGEYVGALSRNCVILAHGKEDRVIPFSHLKRVRDSISSSVNLKVIESEDAGHNDIFYKVEDRLRVATQECLRGKDR